jgi:hypothetical protein
MTTPDAVIEKVARAVKSAMPLPEEVAERVLENLSPGDPLPGGCWVAPKEWSEAMEEAAAATLVRNDDVDFVAVYKAMRRTAGGER